MIPAAADIALIILSVATLLAFVRIWRGPSIEDRVVALDLLATIAVCAIAVYAVRHGAFVLLDVAVVLALIAFIGTVAFAHYVSRRRQV